MPKMKKTESSKRYFVRIDSTPRQLWTIDLKRTKVIEQSGSVGAELDTCTEEFAKGSEAEEAYGSRIANAIEKGMIQTDADDLDFAIIRRLKLSEEDLRLASFRELPPLPKPKPKKFNLDKCIQLLRVHFRQSGHSLDFPIAMEREECIFWLKCLDEISNLYRKSYTSSEKHDFNVLITIDEFFTFIDNNQRAYSTYDSPKFVIILYNLYGIEAITAKLLQACRNNTWYSLYTGLVHGIAAYVKPYLTSDELSRTRATIQSEIDSIDSEADFAPKKCYPFQYIANLFGLTDYAEAFLKTAPDKAMLNVYFGNHYPQLYMFVGLESSTEVARHLHRLTEDLFEYLNPQAFFGMPDSWPLRVFLSASGFDALDLIGSSICSTPYKGDAKEWFRAFTMANGPEAAIPVLRCKLNSSVSHLALAWLEKNVANSIEGLVPAAAGTDQLADAAIEYLQNAKRQGHEKWIEQSVARQPASIDTHRVKEEVLGWNPGASSVDSKLSKTVAETDLNVATPEVPAPEWLQQANVQSKSRKKLPSWALAHNLPPIHHEGYPFRESEIEAIVLALATTDLSVEHPLLEAIQNNVQPHQRDAFVWQLYENWKKHGSDAKERWALASFGHLAGDGVIKKLVDLINEWPGEGHHQRSVFGLEILRAIGSDFALMHLLALSRNAKFPGLKLKATQKADAIAYLRGLTLEECEDRVVPDCGLDSNGKKEFSFGTRSFGFVLGKGTKPMLRDEAGKLLSELPQPKSSDDQAEAEAAINAWKLTKKQIKEVTSFQIKRLESAMLKGRRWKALDFEKYFVRHPLMTLLAQGLLWGRYDSNKKLVSTFRITNERDFADVTDQSISLEPSQLVGIVHPVYLDPSEKAAWNSVMDDYGILQPFAQLEKRVYYLTEEERGQSSLENYVDFSIISKDLFFPLNKTNWNERSIDDQKGMFYKGFGEHKTIGVICHEGKIETWEATKIPVVDAYFVPLDPLSADSASNILSKSRQMTLSEIDPIVINEVISMLRALKHKSEKS